MKKIFCLIFAIAVFCLSAIPVCAAEFAEADSGISYVVDKANVLSEAEEKNLNDKLISFRESNKLDVVIVITNGVLPEERMAFADDFYDHNGYGYGKNNDGVLLLVNLYKDGSYATGNSWISTCGKGIKYISDEKITDIGEKLTPILLKGNYNEAMQLFPDLVKDCISESIRNSVVFIVAFTLIVSVISAFLYGGRLKKQLQTVQSASEADEYIKGDSLKISRSYDHFLYANIVKVKRTSDKSSSTHTSSSGTRHGGGGF